MARRRKHDPDEPETADTLDDGPPTDAPALVPVLAGLHSRTDAGLRPSTRPLARLHRRQGLVIHCTAGNRPERPEDVPRILRAVQAYHQGPRGWSDAGYHWAVDPWGHVWQIRGWGVVGSHAKAGGHNLKSHGVVVLGDGQECTDAEKAALLWLVADADRRFGQGFVRCHGDIQGVAKACPGPAVSAFVRSLGRG